MTKLSNLHERPQVVRYSSASEYWNLFIWPFILSMISIYGVRMLLGIELIEGPLPSSTGSDPLASTRNGLFSLNQKKKPVL